MVIDIRNQEPDSDGLRRCKTRFSSALVPELTCLHSRSETPNRNCLLRLPVLGARLPGGLHAGHGV